MIKKLLIMLTLTISTSCGPRYILRPPLSLEGRSCIVQCQQSFNMCKYSCRDPSCVLCEAFCKVKCKDEYHNCYELCGGSVERL